MASEAGALRQDGSGRWAEPPFEEMYNDILMTRIRGRRERGYEGLEADIRVPRYLFALIILPMS
jgi:hypothetical protein